MLLEPSFFSPRSAFGRRDRSASEVGANFPNRHRHLQEHRGETRGRPTAASNNRSGQSYARARWPWGSERQNSGASPIAYCDQTPFAGRNRDRLANSIWFYISWGVFVFRLGPVFGAVDYERTGTKRGHGNYCRSGDNVMHRNSEKSWEIIVHLLKY